VTNVDVGDALDRARAIAAYVRNAGGRALIVGGWVRDRVMGRDAKDLDLEVYGLDTLGLMRLL
jgi:tRNA nucleotidyltransferase (CCA-adding enzyme)